MVLHQDTSIVRKQVKKIEMRGLMNLKKRKQENYKVGEKKAVQVL